MQSTLCKVIDGLSALDRGFHFYSRETSADSFTFHELRQSVQDLAGKLRALRQKPFERVVLAMSDQAQFIPAFLSIIRAGMVAVPMHPPSLFGDLDFYQKDLERLRRITGARYILVDDSLYTRLHSTLPAGSLLSWSAFGSMTERAELPAVVASDPALIQLLSIII